MVDRPGPNPSVDTHRTGLVEGPSGEGTGPDARLPESVHLFVKQNPAGQQNRARGEDQSGDKRTRLEACRVRAKQETSQGFCAGPVHGLTRGSGRISAAAAAAASTMDAAQPPHMRGAAAAVSLLKGASSPTAPAMPCSGRLQWSVRWVWSITARVGAVPQSERWPRGGRTPPPFPPAPRGGGLRGEVGDVNE